MKNETENNFDLYSLFRSMNHFLLLFLLILLIESSILTGLKHWYINTNPHPWYISKESDLTVSIVMYCMFIDLCDSQNLTIYKLNI